MMTENSEMESDSQLQRSPNNVPIQPVPSKLQRLKRSLSFKTMMRSKSVDNFFLRSNSEARLPLDFITDPPPPSPPLVPGSPLVGEKRSPSVSPSISPNPSVASHSPCLSLSPALPAKPVRPQINHCFQDHVFRKPTNCQHCKNMIVGNSKQALRCKTCKMAAHLWCTSELSQQPCYGKSGAFKRNFSSPMIINDQLAVVKEGQPSQEMSSSRLPTVKHEVEKEKEKEEEQQPEGQQPPQKSHRSRVDPIYAALRYGTSLAHMSRSSFGSLSESPTHSQGEGADEMQRQYSMEEDMPTETAEIPVPDIEIEKEKEEEEPSETSNQTPMEESSVKVPKRIDVQSFHTYVALYKFMPQEQNDLELHPGDRVQVTDDSNEEWWKGKTGDRVGFFPANFVQRVRPGERVWRVIQSSQGSRERGHMPVKESQICVGKREEGEVFVKLSSGKKRGLVAADSIEEI